jgi:hypothetical protein
LDELRENRVRDGPTAGQRWRRNFVKATVSPFSSFLFEGEGEDLVIKKKRQKDCTPLLKVGDLDKG